MAIPFLKVYGRTKKFFRWPRRSCLHHRDNCAGGHGHDQAPLCARGVEIGADLGAIVFKRLRCQIHVALPVDYHLRGAIGAEGDGVSDAGRYLLMRLDQCRGVDRKLR